jgi:hypothetical protein
LRVSADYRTLFTTSSSDLSLRVWGLDDGKERRRFEAIKMPPKLDDTHALATASADGTMVALGNGDKSVQLLHAVSGEERKRLPSTAQLAWKGAFGPEGRTLIIWYPDHSASVWDVATGRELRHFTFGVDAGTVARQPLARPENRGGCAYTAALSPDGRLLVYGSDEFPYVVIHEVATGKMIRSIGDLPDRGVIRLAFSPDSRAFAWAGFQRAIHLVEVATGKERLRFEGHQGNVASLAFSADGRKLVSGSDDTTALVWDLSGDVVGKREPLQPSDLDVYSNDLNGNDAARAYKAIRRLVGTPTEAVAHFRKNLQPAVAGDEKRIAALILDLDSEEFAVRDRVTRELEKLGEAASEACRKALEGQLSPEVRRRLEALARQQADQAWDFSADKLRTLRALEVLELAGTPEARQLLARLANGLPSAWQTREARAALERLQRRHAAR